MYKHSNEILKELIKNKDKLSLNEKKKLLYGLKLLKKKTQKENAMTLSPQEPMWISEEYSNTERNVVAKTFSVQDEFENYVNKNRGIQFTPKELDSITNFKTASPSSQDPFVVRFEKTDDFGNNQTIVIKKHRQGNQFVFTAYTKYDSMEPMGSEEPDIEMGKQQKPMSQSSKKPPVMKEENEMENKVIVTKTITFSDDTQGSDILADFLRKLDL